MPVDPEVKMFVQDAVAEAIEKHEAENEENIKKLNTVHDTVIKIDTMLEEVDRHEHSEHHHWVKSTIRKQEAEAKKLTSEAAFWTFAGKLAGNKSFWTFLTFLLALLLIVVYKWVPGAAFIINKIFE